MTVRNDSIVGLGLEGGNRAPQGRSRSPPKASATSRLRMTRRAVSSRVLTAHPGSGTEWFILVQSPASAVAHQVRSGRGSIASGGGRTVPEPQRLLQPPLPGPLASGRGEG